MADSAVLEPVEAHVVEQDGLRLVVDPIALAALAAARSAGMTRACDVEALPSLDELPLRFVVLEVRVAALELRERRRERAMMNSGICL